MHSGPQRVQDYSVCYIFHNLPSLPSKIPPRSHKSFWSLKWAATLRSEVRRWKLLTIQVIHCTGRLLFWSFGESEPPLAVFNCNSSFSKRPLFLFSQSHVFILRLTTGDAEKEQLFAIPSSETMCSPSIPRHVSHTLSVDSWKAACLCWRLSSYSPPSKNHHFLLQTDS